MIETSEGGLAVSVDPPELGGSATGAVNFVNFTFSALLGPVFARLALEHYQTAFALMLAGVAIAAALTCFLRETGPSARRRST